MKSIFTRILVGNNCEKTQFDADNAKKIIRQEKLWQWPLF
jgi:hypothetical protein